MVKSGLNSVLHSCPYEHIPTLQGIEVSKSGQDTTTVLYLAPHTPGGLQVVLVDLVDSIWSPPGFHKNTHITTEFSGVHLESTWSPPGVQLDFT